MELIVDHLRRLVDFSGREARGRFWPWVACVVGLSMLGMVAFMVPFMMNTFAQMRAFAQAHPDQATVTQGPGHYAIEIHRNAPDFGPEYAPDFSPLMIGFGVLVLINVALLAAAVARRLHDRGMVGYWGLLPLPFAAGGLGLMALVFGQPEPDLSLFFGAFACNMLYNVSLIVLVVFLCAKSDAGENRFGPPPAP